MTEPDVASSDARNIQSSIERDGDDYVINGRKWWSSGAASPRARVGIFMGVTDADADTYHQQSMILVPFDTPGVEMVRELPVLGRYDGHGGHPEMRFTDVRVPASNLIGHHCMRAIGMAERSLELLIDRAVERVAFGKRLADQGKIQHWIAQSRVRIEAARTLTLKTAWLMDTLGNKGARMEISAIKLAAPAAAEYVIDKAIQVHGGAGVSDDTPLATFHAHIRTMRLFDGPDEVHEMSIARREIRARE
jgi:acyl-CoA dehydrogenase